MKKLFTVLVFVSGLFLFSCEDASEELFKEVDASETSIMEDLDAES